MNILMLHDVRPFDSKFFPNRYKQHSFLTDTAFANGLCSIRQKIVSFDEMLNRLIHDKQISSFDGKYALTFDDGLKDHLKVAEILADKGIKAAFFIPFGIVGSDSFIHSHLIQFLIASNKRNLIASALELVLSDEHGLAMNEINEYKKSKWKNNLWTPEEVFITRVFREAFKYEYREFLLREFFKKYVCVDIQELHSGFYLSKTDLTEISSMGHHIGSHGFFSLDLRYESSSTVTNELLDSFKFLVPYENQFNTISYPNGGYSECIRSTVQQAGFEIGFGTTHRAVQVGDDLLHLPRLDGTKLGIFV